MDSNFQVKVSADISALQASLKKVETDLAKFKKSADGAAGATKNMEQNANRGRMVAFAFGQVIRDAGFFANNFSLGILAISNNIPILIDQISLSVKALQPFAGALSLVGSLLTAGLTIWAYSSQAVKENKQTIEQYISSLDDLREAQLNAALSADDEIRSLNLLRKAAQDETFSRKERLKAVKELQERFPDYYASLSAETIMAGKDARAHRELASAIKAVAEAEAYKELIKENRKVELADNEKLVDLQAERVKFEKQLADLRSQGPTGLTGSRTGIDYEFRRKEEELVRKIYDTDQQIFGVAKERNKARETGNRLEESLLNTLQKQKKVSTITGGFGDSPEKIKSQADVYKELNLELKKINSNLTLTFTEKSKNRANAYQKAIESLIEMGLDPANEKIAELQMLALGFNYDAEGLKRFEEGLKRAAKAASTLQAQVDKEQGKNGLPIPESDMPPVNDPLLNMERRLTPKEIEAYANSLLPSVMEVYSSIAATITDGMAEVTFAIADGIGKMLTGEMGVKEFGKSILASIGSFLSQLGKQMMAFGVAALLFGKLMVAMASGGPAAMIALAPGLIAAGAALAIAGSVITSLASGGAGAAGATGGAGGGFNGRGFQSGFTTPMTSAVSSAMYGRYNGTLETRVSGNDLVILMNRADRNRRGNY